MCFVFKKIMKIASYLSRHVEHLPISSTRKISGSLGFFHQAYLSDLRDDSSLPNSCPAKAALADMPVKGSERNPHPLGDGADRQVSCAHQSPRPGDVVRGEGRRATALATAAACFRQPRRSSFFNERLFELGDGAENMKDQPPARRCRVEMLGQRHQPDIPVVQILSRCDELLKGACQAIQLPHDEGVAPAQHVVEDAFQLGPGGAVAGRFLAKDLLAASRGQRLELKSGDWSRVETRA
jgi:hypothetical protein